MIVERLGLFSFHSKSHACDCEDAHALERARVRVRACWRVNAIERACLGADARVRAQSFNTKVRECLRANANWCLFERKLKGMCNVHV